MRLDLKDLVLFIPKDGKDVENNVLRLHVLHEWEGQGTSLAWLDVDIVAQGRQVAQDTGLGRCVLWERLGRRQHTAEEDHIDRSGLVVDNLNHGLGRVTIHKLHAEGRVREGGRDVNLQLGGFGARRGGRILGLEKEIIRVRYLKQEREKAKKTISWVTRELSWGGFFRRGTAFLPRRRQRPRRHEEPGVREPRT